MTLNGGVQAGYDLNPRVNVFVNGQAYLLLLSEEDTQVFAAMSPEVDTFSTFSTAWTIPVTAGLRIKI